MHTMEDEPLMYNFKDFFCFGGTLVLGLFNIESIAFFPVFSSDTHRGDVDEPFALDSIEYLRNSTKERCLFEIIFVTIG